MRRKMRWAQVRRKTDSGETGDKVNHPDPAAAPLGTDEEAGGAATPLEEIAASTERRARDGKGVEEAEARSPSGSKNR